MYKYDLAIIIPCLNEEKNLTKVVLSSLKELKINNINGQIIIIDDGSADKTHTIAKNISQKFNNVSLKRHKINQGFGAAFWTGVKVSNATYTSILPGDGEIDITQLTRCYKDIKTTNHDVIIPYVEDGKSRSFFRRFLSKIYSQSINLIFRVNVKYTNSCNIYKTSLLKKLTHSSTGFFFQSEIIIKLIKSGSSYKEIPINLSKRISGKSKAIRFNVLFILVKDILQTFYTLNIKKII
jgi:glycosyltransferase involved in cell wall biosynthesis